MQNLSTQAASIQQGAEDQANGMNKFSIEMTDEVSTFNQFNKMVDTIPNPIALWSLFTNHLNDVITDCNTLLNPPTPPTRNYTLKRNQQKQQGLKMTLADANAVCSNLIAVSSTDNMCTDVASGACPDDYQTNSLFESGTCADNL